MSEDIITEQVAEATEKPKEVVETAPKYTQEEDAAYIQKLKKENEKYRKDFEKKLDQEKEAKKIALEEQGKYKELYEKTLKDVETSKTDLLETSKENALALALRDAEATNPELLMSLFKTPEGKYDFELGQDKKIVGWEGIINPIKEKYSPQFGKEVKVGYDPNKPTVNNEEFFSQEEMELMSKEDLVVHYDKVQKSLQQT